MHFQNRVEYAISQFVLENFCIEINREQNTREFSTLRKYIWLIRYNTVVNYLS